MIRLVIHTERASHHWTVRVNRERRDGEPVGRHELAAIVDPRPGGWRGWLPKPADAEPLRRASHEEDEFEAVWALYGDLLKRQASEDRVVEVFGRYLFDALLGPVWPNVTKAVAGEPVELALCWGPAEVDLLRLPWEMMWAEGGFLASKAQLPITRLVPDTSADLSDVPLLPRVLFAVGAEPDDPEIQAGAEYIGLVRQLRSNELSLNTRVLLGTDANGASLRDLSQAVGDYRPTVVHLICHGGFEPRQGPYLELRSEVKGGTPQRVQAEQLALALKDPGPRPPVVVLNACHTSRPPEDRVAAPFAAALVKEGIPVVVGMWGRVADQACRLFTRRLYEEMLAAESTVARAVSEGRRAGYLESLRDPGRRGDWAFPTIFVGEGVSGRTAFDVKAKQRARQLQQIRRTYAPSTAPVCDRVEVLERWYPQLVPADGRGPLRVVALHESLDLSGRPCGKSRLLEELAGRAVADGHVVCSVPETVAPPSTMFELVDRLGDAMTDTRDHFALEQPVYQSALLREAAEGDANARERLDARVTRRLPFSGWPAEIDKLSSRVIGEALRQDLAALARQAREDAGHTERLAVSGAPLGAGVRVLVLMDRIHDFGAAALRLLTEELLGVEGAGTPDDPVPVVVTYSAAQAGREDAPQGRLLKTLHESTADYIQKLELGRFAPPERDPLPYDQYLLGRKPPLVMRHEIVTEQQVALAYQKLWAVLEGDPVKLRGHDKDLEVVIEIFSDPALNIIGAADDEELMRNSLETLRGG